MVLNEQQRRCPHCQEFHPVAANYCPQTGMEIVEAVRTCPTCGFAEIQDQEYCPNCGSWLQPGEQGRPADHVPASEDGVEPALLPAQGEKPDEQVVDSVPYLAQIGNVSSDVADVQQQVLSSELAQVEESAPPAVGESWQEQTKAWTGFSFIQLVAIVGVLILGLIIGSALWSRSKPTPVSEVVNETAIVSPTLANSTRQTPLLAVTATDMAPVQATVTSSAVTEDVPQAQAVISVPNTPAPTTTSTPKPATSTPLPTSTPAGPVGLIAFNSNRLGNNDIYVMNADGSGVTQLTTSGVDDRVPSWSPDGEKIAYQSNDGGDYEITVYTLSSKNIRQVTNNSCDDYNPVWSPDGRRLAFYSDCDGNREIYLVNADGTGLRQLSHTQDGFSWFPNWSPDGGQIVFSSYRGSRYEVWMMSADGSGAHSLGAGCLASFSPDGQWLVFTEYCADLGALYRMRPDGSNRKTLDKQYNSTNPSWSPDGSKIIFQSDRSGNEEIWMMDADSSDWVQLTFDSARDSAPVWQPGRAGGSGTASQVPGGSAGIAPGSVQVSPVDGMARLYVPAGEFVMGSPESDSRAFAEEVPQHTVDLEAFWIDKTEITNAMFAQFAAETGYQTRAERVGWSYTYSLDIDGLIETNGAEWQHPSGHASSITGLGDHPVVQVNWHDAQAYCEWAGRRLPSEAEWEKAARGAQGYRYPWGNQQAAGNLLNFADRQVSIDWADQSQDDGYAFTAPVGSYPDGASPYGALDMAGNVWEWVTDWYDEAYYTYSPVHNPPGPSPATYRVLRGGGWNAAARVSRAANRGWGYPDKTASNLLGFRCSSDDR